MLLHKTIIGEGTPIVWVHGFGFSSRIWPSLIEQTLPRQYQSILLDLPGFGCSAPGRYELASLTATLRQVVETPAVWLGWSLGGVVASAFAHRYPQQVKKLITVSCNPVFVEQPDWPGVTKERFDQFCQLAHSHPAQLLKQFVRLQCLGEPQQRSKIRYLMDLLQQEPLPSAETLSASLRLLADYDARSVWRQLTIPQLHVFGEIDALIPNTVVDEVQRLLPDQEVVRFANCGHQPFIANSHTFIPLIQEFMNAC